MTTLRLALRNIARNRRRSIATIAAIMVGAVSVLLFGGFSREIQYGLLVESIRQYGHLQVQQKNYHLFGSADPTAYSIREYERMIEAIRTDEMLSSTVRVVSPSLQFGGIAGNFSAGRSRTAMGVAVIPADVDRMQQWDERGVTAPGERLLLTGTDENSAMIGTGLARALQFCEQFAIDQCIDGDAENAGENLPALPGDILSLAAKEAGASSDSGRPRFAFLAATAQGAPNIADLEIAGVTSVSSKAVDDVLVAMHLSQAQQLIYGREAPQITALVVQLERTEQMPAARARLAALLDEQFPDQALAIYDFAELNPYFGQATGFLKTIFAFIAVLMALIVAFSVSNTMSMIVAERTNEIGTLRAIGVRRSGIRRLFITEGAMFGIVGAALGVLAAVAIASGVNVSDIRWTPPGRGEPTDLVTGWGGPGLVAATLFALIVLAIASSWWSARRGAKLIIVDALRHA